MRSLHAGAETPIFSWFGTPGSPAQGPELSHPQTLAHRLGGTLWCPTSDGRLQDFSATITWWVGSWNKSPVYCHIMLLVLFPRETLIHWKK